MALEKIGVEAVIDGLRSFNRGIDSMDRGVSEFGKTTEGVSVKTIALGNILADLAIGAAKLVTDAIIGISKATVQLAVDSTKLASEFQDSLVVLQLSARDTGLSLEGLSDVALQVGGDTSLVGVSATGAAEAMTGLFKAGLDTTEVFGDLNGFMNETAELGGALRASIDLAAASELDMVQASDLAAVALSTFGGNLETTEERAKFVNDAMNNFVQAADASVADVGDLAQALKNVGPTAASMGFEIEEVNNGLAILSTRGINGAEAGTQLKSMLLNLTRPVGKVQETLRDLNVELFDQEGNMKDLRTIIGDLQVGMEDLTQEQRNLAIQTLAGSFGQAGLNTLLAEGVEGWDAMADATANATTIQEQALARTQTLSGQMEALDGVIETLKIQLGNAFLPIATKWR
jgi:TP901 family phage tail tape measure protein